MTPNRLSYWILSLLYLSITICCGSWNLYKSSHSTRKTTRLFDRLKYHETVSFTHNQFHEVDTGSAPIYPMNGRLSFHAFGRHYSLLIRKNMELFSDSYHTEIHRFNESTQQTDKFIHSTEIPQCYYTAEVESDASFQSRGLFSACRGRGIRGWIYAFGERIVIRPKLHLMDVTFKGRHRISDDHIVYRYSDLDRSDYPHNDGAVCGHGHPLTQDALDQEIATHNDGPMVEWIHHQRNHTKLHLNDNLMQDIEHSMPYNDIRRRLASETTRYVELAVVNDPGMIAERGSDYDLIEEKTIAIVAHLQDYYLGGNFGVSVGTIQIVLSAIFYIDSFGTLSEPALDCFGSATSATLYDNTPGDNYCEVSYASYLSNFQSYRQSHLSDYDNAQLFSYYDFRSTVIGYASLPGMCIGSSSGGIEQCTYDDEYNANIVAHEMGHNFNMQHDGNGNDCSPENYIMASVGNPQGYRPSAFSSCSVTYTQSFFSSFSHSLRCLDNKPQTSRYSVCRNGFVEEGESCDCGSANCGSVDACCDGSTCALYASSECSNNDICCSDCKVKASGTVCRALNTDNTCDIEEEICDGNSPECPPDLKYVEGTICLSDSGTSFGYCYSGSCKSVDTQCALYGAINGDAYTVADVSCSGWPLDWQISDNKCDSSIKCERVNNALCATLSGEKPDEGMPCNQSINPSLTSQCVDSICQSSLDILSYTWTVNQWDTCNISCKADDNDVAGYQTRSVECTLQDGTVAPSEDDCDPNGDSPKPVDGRICNNYVCEFCAIQPNGLTICGQNGDCNDPLKTCDCDSGWSGELCNEAPSLNFTGITSSLYQTATQTIVQRVNPCNDTIASYDNATNTRTIPINAASLTDLYIGASVGVRWTTTGDVKLLAVGLEEVDAETGETVTDNYLFPFYVGTSLARDKPSCDQANSTNYDPCLNKIECDDFSFTIPTDIIPSTYKLLIRFNNEYHISSPILNINCHDSVCNSIGHGECNDNPSESSDICVCDDGYSGSSCSESLCNDWSFALCDRDEYGNCGSSGSTDYKSKCFNSTCSLSLGCSTVCSDPNFEGTYCEVPADFCGSMLSADACNDPSLSLDSCIWSSTFSKCLYKECAPFLSKNSCESWIDPTNSSVDSWLLHDDKWTTFCAWNDDGYCNRITCGGGELPPCGHGTVRRPIFDFYSSDIPISICRAWFCDCTTATDGISYWKESTAATLLSSITSTYNMDSDSVLSSSYINDESLDLFTCNHCSLSCENGAVLSDGSCDDCSINCPVESSPFRSGLQCDQAFWIANFRINIDNSIYMNNKLEFESLLILDLSYFLSTSTERLSIWQIKPDGDKSIVYFRYLFETNDDDDTQAIGGDVMYFAGKELQDDTSTSVRGFLMQYSDYKYKFTFCVPTKEECDPSKRISILFYFYICCGSSFGLVVLFVICYRIFTRAKRQRAYEAKVRQVRQAQLRLMEHHSKARRVGMRDVSKHRAAKIHKAQRKNEKEQLTEIKTRAKQEKQLNKEQLNAPNSYQSHHSSHQDSQVELEQYRRYSAQQEQQQQQQQQGQYAQSAQYAQSYQPPNIMANAAVVNRPFLSQSVHTDVLPDTWKIYYNEDGIPYYYNHQTGETTWRRPN